MDSWQETLTFRREKHQRNDNRLARDTPCPKKTSLGKPTSIRNHSGLHVSSSIISSSKLYAVNMFLPDCFHKIVALDFRAVFFINDSVRQINNIHILLLCVERLRHLDRRCSHQSLPINLIVRFAFAMIKSSIGKGHLIDRIWNGILQPITWNTCFTTHKVAREEEKIAYSLTTSPNLGLAPTLSLGESDPLLITKCCCL
jgi:hypothetical protein